MAPEPESLILQLLRDMRAELADMRQTMATKDDLAATRSELKSDIADVASDLLDLRADMNGMRKELSDQIVGLRRAVMEYHTSVIGHGILIQRARGATSPGRAASVVDPSDAH